MTTDRNVPVRDLEEGAEILLRSATGEAGIVEMVSTAWAGIGNRERTTVTLIDGRSLTLSADRLVTVLS
jgi:hypothetical protein